MNHELMARQRCARLEREAAEAIPKTLWDQINSSAGDDSCHPWEGKIDTAFRRDKLPIGKFVRAGMTDEWAHRATVEDYFGVTLDSNDFINQICGNTLCCNIRHLAIATARRRMNSAIPVCEYFEKEEMVHALLGKQGEARQGNHRNHVRQQNAGAVLR